jgi:adenylylsulfate kinase
MKAPMRVSSTAGAIVWFTGLPACGKSTLARRVQQQVARTARASVLLDGDEVREILGEHGYGDSDRERFYRELAALAALIAKQGVVVLVAATAPRREDRDRARGLMPEGGFVEVWVNTRPEDCEARDPKGLYAQARRDPANTLPGVGADYEPPLAPEVIADGGFDDAAAAVIECRLVHRSTNRDHRQDR